MDIPARVLRQFATLRGGGEEGGDSRGLDASWNSGSSGVSAARAALEGGVRVMDPSIRSFFDNVQTSVCTSFIERKSFV
jgi:hypothetical protein